MEPGDPWLTGAIFVLLLASAFFSAAETALMALNRIRLKMLVEEEDPRAMAADNLLQNPNRLQGTILVGNNLANILAVAAGAALALGHFGADIGLGLAAVGSMLLILILGEIAPKVYAASNAERVALAAARPLAVLVNLLYPLVQIYTLFSVGLVRLFGGKVSVTDPYQPEDELRAMVSAGQQDGHLETDEKEMIDNIFEFGDTFVRDVMVPRTDIISVGADISFPALTELIREQQFSRVPVYEGTIDNIVGIIYVKDLFVLGATPLSHFLVTEHMREAYFVPEMKRIDGLFKEMRENKVHMAVVLDEYGGTAGIVTIEDLVEEIVGEISDEYDLEQDPLVETVDERTYLVDAGLRIEEVNDLLGVNLPNHDIETIGGFVLSRLERIPDAGDIVEWEGYQIEILAMEGRRMTRLRLTRPEVMVS